jgi:hypothetical protein
LGNALKFVEAGLMETGLDVDTLPIEVAIAGTADALVVIAKIAANKLLTEHLLVNVNKLNELHRFALKPKSINFLKAVQSTAFKKFIVNCSQRV